MKIPFSLLSIAARQDPLEVPANPSAPKFGIGRVVVRELSPLVFDELWTNLVVAERIRIESRAHAQQHRTDTQAQQALTLAKQKEREAQDVLICSMIVGHDEETFCCEVPIADSDSPHYAQILKVLDGVGYSAAEATIAAKTGKASKKFKSAGDGADVEMARFYRRCQPDGSFLTTLLFMMYRFQQGELLTPQAIWEANEVPKEDIPPSF